MEGILFFGGFGFKLHFVVQMGNVYDGLFGVAHSVRIAIVGDDAG